MTKEKFYLDGVNEAAIVREEAFDPQGWKLLTYSCPSSVDKGFPSGKLGNMAGGFPFELFGRNWKSVEHLYLCGEWSWGEADERGETKDERISSTEIQEYIFKMSSGSWAKKCSKTKYKKLIRSDFKIFRKDWMLWCVWVKCMLNADFRELLKSVPEDTVIVELNKKDPIWSMWPDETGILRGKNGMGKILNICRQCLIDGTEPKINTDLLNKANINLFGKRINF